VPRDSTDKVAEAVTPHYGQFSGKDGQVHPAVVSDVRVHPHTQKSRDMQEMIRHGLISFVSVEHGGDERMNPATRQMEAHTLTFSGFAFVNKGACKLCRLNEQPPSDAPKETPAIPPEEPEMDTKELEAKLEAVTKELEAVKAQKPAAVTVEIPKELAEAVGTIKTLAARIDALEKDGTPATGAGATHELEAQPEFHVRVDRKKGIVEA
jgi:outer membrane murein-binding lipoprotein Lpp